ncbi:2-hydroxymuconate semialdehyde hydrolase [Enhygromyxa salina]|uniref:2-hydroxymuconate semialdehyde hydrolase n=1 Tax=Enhygromyxa salina TaxID=215803 RepID=A0A2S9YDR5_9BACT|nr:alpha/beta hydrolase [Enhygromyxa salina]PRQ03267.1 2-hydroxymuconate semialdehyde hydrolase [Enhygromyxa salina]
MVRLPEDRSRLLPMAPGRLWIQDLGPTDEPGLDDPPPVLMLHSLLVTGWDFRFLAEPLAAAGRRVLVPDLFGCGNSDRPGAPDTTGYGFAWHAELLARMLDRLGLTRVDVIGHGYGGSVAIHLARRLERPHGEHRVALRRLTLIAPHCLPVAAPIALPGPMPRLHRAWSWVGFAPLVFRTAFRRADLRRFLRRSLSIPEQLDSEPLRNDVDVYWDRLCRDGGLEAVQAMLAQLDRLHEIAPDGVRERLHAAARSITSETMLIWGDHDAIVPSALAERTQGLLPGAELRIIEGCGHAPQRERPEALREVLDSFGRRMND